MSYDVIVIGVGGMGSSACYHLAKRKAKVLGLEQFSIGHDQGSSHGETRMIRQAYFEHPSYVPLLISAYQNWEILEKECREKLFVRSGIVYGLAPGGEVYSGVKQSAKAHGLNLYEGVSVKEKWSSYFQFDNCETLFEENAGFLYVEKCVQNYVKVARKMGAGIHENEKVLNIRRDGNGFFVETSKDRYSTAQIIVAAGPWLTNLFPRLKNIFQVRRKTLWWFESSDLKLENGAPCFFFDHHGGHFYGFPDFGNGLLKCALHTGGEDTGVESINRAVSNEDAKMVIHYAQKVLRLKSFNPVKGAVCLYTMTKDSHFVIDQHPEMKGITLLSPCSGHGFKFASIMGEIAADLSLNGKTRHPIDFFNLKRKM